MKKIMLSVVCTAVSLLAAADLFDGNFQKGVNGWQCPAYWSGRIRAVNGNLEFLPAAKGGKHWARAYRIYSNAKNLPGKVLEMTSSLSGKGKARLGAIIYTKDFYGKTQIQYSWGPFFPLNEKGADHKHLIDLSELSPFQLGLCVEISGKDPARCRRVRLLDVTGSHKMETVWLSAQPEKKVKLGAAVYSQNFDTSCGSWQSPAYWGGKLSFDKAGWGKLLATKHGAREYGSMYSIIPDAILQTGGLYEYSVCVKGRGKVRLGAIVYGRNEKNQRTYPSVWSKETSLTANWQKVKYLLDLSHSSPMRLALRVELTTPGEVCVDNVLLRKMFDPFLNIKPLREYAAWSDKHPLPPLGFQISDKTAKAVLFTPCDPATPAGVEVKCDKNGQISLSAAQTGKGKAIFLASRGQLSRIRLDKLAVEKYAQYEALSRKLSGEKIKNILIIGDSLLDKDFSLNRDKGAVKQLDFWLNLHAPGRYNIRNAAVRGDCIERVWNRMSFELKLSKRAAFMQDTYSGLFKFPADIIFVLLGHNDTTASSKENFASARINPEKQEALYRKMLTRFRKTWPLSRIVLVSSTSSNDVLTRKKAELLLRKDPARRVTLFGVPACMERYNAVLQKIAPDFKADFYDIYTPMKALKQTEKAGLLNPNDGVHLSEAGQSYLMFQFLKYLAALK